MLQNENPKVVPIVFATDNNFIRQTIVTLVSILENRKRTYFLDIFILVSKYEKINSGQFVDRLFEMYNNFNIQFIEIDEDIFSNVNMRIAHITKPTYFRLLIPELLQKYDKCIYLDGDIIIYDDIINLFIVDIQNYLLGGVKIAKLNIDKDEGMKYSKTIGIENTDNYINAGVLLMNLEFMRKENMVKSFIECAVTRKLPMQDQDVINICCFGKIKILPYYFNTYLKEIGTDRNKMDELYGKINVEKAYGNPFLLHFADEFTKPWKNIGAVMTDYWWNIAKIILSPNEYKELQDEADMFMQSLFFSVLLNKCQEAKNIILFGYSSIGKSVYNSLIKNNIDSVCCFCDNDSSKKGEEYQGVFCKTCDEALLEWPDSYIIITSQRYYRDIKEQLLKLDIPNERIIRYLRKPAYLLSIMKDEYQEKVLADARLESEIDNDWFGENQYGENSG